MSEVANGFLISWQEPLERTSLIQHYTITYRLDNQWKTLNRGQIRPLDTSYLVKNLVGGRTYYFRILAHAQNTFETSEEVKFPVPARVKHKAITAGVVGGILFFIVAIILSICTVKICNQRKRRKQEKGERHLLCPISVEVFFLGSWWMAFYLYCSRCIPIQLDCITKKNQSCHKLVGGGGWLANYICNILTHVGDNWKQKWTFFLFDFCLGFEGFFHGNLITQCRI